MKILLLIFTVSLGLSTSAKACEPPPSLDSECKFGEKVDYQDQVTQELYKNVKAFYDILLAEIKGKKPKVFKSRYGDGSCYLFNFAPDHLKDLKDFAKSHLGKICSQDAGYIKSELERLIDPKAEELGDIDSKDAMAKLKELRQAIQKTLPRFMKAHQASKK